MDANSKWYQDFDGVTKIKVYWENASADNYQERMWVQEAINASWSKYANVDFVGWQSFDGASDGIRIFIDNYDRPHTNGLGRHLNGQYHGMVLNFRFLGQFKCYDSYEYCIKAIAIHEFGHALGIAHEQDRKDCGCNRTDENNLGINGGYYVTPCDIHSVMNYCNPIWNNGGVLSAYDVIGIQAVYGARKNMLGLGNKDGISQATDKLGDYQYWETLNLTIGDQQFIYNVNRDNIEEIKSFKFGRTGTYQYKISSVYLGKDNIRHIGNGSGSIYIDKAKSYKFEFLTTSRGDIDEVNLTAHDGLTNEEIRPEVGEVNRSRAVTKTKMVFLEDGKRPIGLILLTNDSDEKFYIYADGNILCYNMKTNQSFWCARKTPPVYKDWNGKIWAWSFNRSIGNDQEETYSVSTSGEIWSMSTTGTLEKYGGVYTVDF